MKVWFNIVLIALSLQSCADKNNDKDCKMNAGVCGEGDSKKSKVRFIGLRSQPGIQKVRLVLAEGEDMYLVDMGETSPQYRSPEELNCPKQKNLGRTIYDCDFNVTDVHGRYGIWKSCQSKTGRSDEGMLYYRQPPEYTTSAMVCPSLVDAKRWKINLRYLNGGEKSCYAFWGSESDSHANTPCDKPIQISIPAYSLSLVHTLYSEHKTYKIRRNDLDPKDFNDGEMTITVDWKHEGLTPETMTVSTNLVGFYGHVETGGSKNDQSLIVSDFMHSGSATKSPSLAFDPQNSLTRFHGQWHDLITKNTALSASLKISGPFMDGENVNFDFPEGLGEVSSQWSQQGDFLKIESNINQLSGSWSLEQMTFRSENDNVKVSWHRSLLSEGLSIPIPSGLDLSLIHI